MIDPDDIQALAERLMSETTEVEWRCAVSRAYYAVFHRARRLLRDLGFRVPRAEQAHSYLWLRLSNCGEAQVQSAGSDLNILRRERNQADYDLDRNFSRPHTQLQVDAARRIMQILDAATAEPTRSQIAATMRAYERDVLRETTWHA